MPTASNGGWHVAVGLPEQKARLVFASASTGLSEASEAIREPHIFLKVCSTPDRMARCLAPGWEMQPPGYLMEQPVLGTASADGLSLRQETPDLLKAEIVRDGIIAARGTVVLVDGFAIFDRIETAEAYRRQGLGRRIMGHLGAAAHAAGAHHGLLVATAEGRALYEAIGWRLHSPYSTAVRPSNA
ncbi:GNAT family N-acetyltransferase [Sphingomonas sp. PR090111-T3T-6A]|uniref:GNAT family N-acetyltransferase n=1 Tax=Sphingomonas sp. PR090111-T3T-6A TaxID=685778 RepID=UPI0012F9231A|nr:GNAT family N-acetyltransferase [Sphingomonas sp. PR090111-T3T-6A]